jgi:peroxiredoxin
MRKILILAVAVFILACSRKQEGYEIKVNLEGASGSILLERRGETGWIPVDTALIDDGTAVLQGKVAFPEDYYLSVLGQRPKTILFVENTRMTVVGSADSLENVTVTGSKTHDEYTTVNSKIQKIGEEYMELYQQAREAVAANDTTKGRLLMEQVQELYSSTTVIQQNFVRDNPGSFAAPYFLMRVQHGMETGELDVLLSSLNPELDSVPDVKALKSRVEKLKTVEIGQTAPDFIMNDPGGNPIRFSDVYSQYEYTLLDFWAAWCGPCREENPNIVSVYNKFKDKGFGVFGVSLDRDREAWLKAIEDDHLTWTHVSDLSYWNNAAAQMYVVNSIPSSLIVDQNGKIVAKNKRDQELGETVARLLN